MLNADGEATWVSLLADNTVLPENIYSCILKVIGQVWESKKGDKIQH